VKFITPILSRYVPLAVLLAVCAAICGCTETRFAAMPDDQLQSCDARWKGLWIPSAEPDSDGAFSIDANCRFVMIDIPKNGAPIKRTPIAVSYLHVDGKDYVVVPDDGLKDLVDIEPVYGIEPVPTRAYFVARYVLDKDRIDVYSVDSERLAIRIIAGKLDGTVTKTPNNLHVFVTGDAAHTLEVLRGESIFADKPSMELERSDLSVDEFERRAVQQRDMREPLGHVGNRHGQEPFQEP